MTPLCNHGAGGASVGCSLTVSWLQAHPVMLHSLMAGLGLSKLEGLDSIMFCHPVA